MRGNLVSNSSGRSAIFIGDHVTNTTLVSLRQPTKAA